LFPNISKRCKLLSTIGLIILLVMIGALIVVSTSNGEDDDAKKKQNQNQPTLMAASPQQQPQPSWISLRLPSDLSVQSTDGALAMNFDGSILGP
jgi:hypothetical protein